MTYNQLVDIPFINYNQPENEWFSTIKLKGITAIPAEKRTYEMYIAAVQIDGTLIEHVPDSINDMVMCLYALKQTPNAYHYISPMFKTHHLRSIAESSPNFEEMIIRKK